MSDRKSRRLGHRRNDVLPGPHSRCERICAKGRVRVPASVQFEQLSTAATAFAEWACFKDQEVESWPC